MKSILGAGLSWLLAVALSLPLPLNAQDAPQQAAFKPEEIEQLVAPIALYPDALVAQILMASTYPLEVVQAARWVKSNPGLKDQALEDALQPQPWDPSVKSLAALPQVLTMMSEKLDMTQKLGDAFLAQEKDVLDAVQRLRVKAQTAGNLKTGKEQVVSTDQQGGTTVIKIEPASPQVVYVPTYNPTVVYGAWPYPAYPPYYYYPPGYVAGTAIFSFAVGVAVGNAMWGNCNWRGGSVNINVNRYNSYNRTTINNTNWQHNVNHRKGVQYRDSVSQQRYGGGQRQGVESRDAFRGRAEQGRRDMPRADAGRMQRDARAADRAGAAGRSTGGPANLGGAAADRAGGAGGQRATTQRAGGGAFDGAGRGGGAQAHQFSNRGAASRQSMGGGARAGGGRRR